MLVMFMFGSIMFLTATVTCQDCPTDIIQDCISEFNRSISTSQNVCRETEILEECTGQHADVCETDTSFTQALHLIRDNGFLQCYCPESYIRHFLNFFLSTNKCRNLRILETFIDSFRSPSCERSWVFNESLVLQRKLKESCTIN